MKPQDEIDSLFEDTDTLEQLLDVDNVEAVPPSDHSDIISLGEESVIEECLNDTDGSLSSVNLDFFNEDKPIRSTRKKTMEKRKEERMSFRHVVDKITGTDDEDDEDLSSIETAAKNELAALAFQIKQTKETIGSNSKKYESTDTVRGKKILDPNNSKEINHFKKILHVYESDKEREPEELLIDDDIKMAVLRETKRLQLSEVVNELRRNCEEGKTVCKKEINDVTDEVLEDVPSNMDFKLPSINKNRNVSREHRRKRILLSPESDSEDKSDKEFQDIETNEAIDDVEPSTSKDANVINKRVGRLKRLLISDCDEKEGELYSNDETNQRSCKNSNVAKRKVVKRKKVVRKRRVSAKRQEIANNAHIYSFFSSMADLVSRLPYSATLTAKARVTKILEEMVTRVTKAQDDRLPLQAITSHEISEEDLKLIKLRLSELPYIY